MSAGTERYQLELARKSEEQATQLEQGQAISPETQKELRYAHLLGDPPAAARDPEVEQTGVSALRSRDAAHAR